MGQELLERKGGYRKTGRLRRRRQSAGKIRARLQQIDHHQAEQQRNERGGNEPAHRLGENSPELGAAAHMGDPANKCCEHEGGDDHLDQAKKQHRHKIDRRGEL
jgi:hypothetical protein